MKLLWVATKPPVPAHDGGRLLLAETLRALATRGHEIHVVAPTATPPSVPEPRTRSAPDAWVTHLVAASPRRPVHLLRALWRDPPVTIARHAQSGVADVVGRLVSATRFDVVHAEQLHAFAQCRAATERGVPVVLRAQNVESDLWRDVAPCLHALRPLAAREATRLAGYEAATLRNAAATIALTDEDAARLRTLGGRGVAVHRVAAPFAAEARAPGPPLPGRPAVVLLAGRGWLPGVVGARWFLRAAWPRVRARLPAAELHVFGVAPSRSQRGVVHHPAPPTSTEAFAQNALLVVPLRIASGVRMKILEAWARGVPVVATPPAASGLGARHGRELLVARDGDEFAAALAALAGDDTHRAAIVRDARAFLRTYHDPAMVADQLTTIAADVASAAMVVS
jgi:polysaccharide biosynthesis protein PslH